MKKAITAVIGTAALAAPLAGAAVGSAAPRSPVAFDYWHGSRAASQVYGAVRPRVLGGEFGEPLTDMHWQSWGSTSATARGELVHMACQPCQVTVRLSGVTRSHGWLYYGGERVTFTNGDGAQSLRWSWASKGYA